jgi:hypothetical protein
MSRSSPYHFVTTWRVRGLAEDVYQILEKSADLAGWWPAVFLRLKAIEPGDAAGINAVFDVHTRGWLPYTLCWQLRTLGKERPRRIALEAKGDLTGLVVWTVTPTDSWVEIAFALEVAANQPPLGRWSWLLRPVFTANLRWAMARGAESLQRELAFRQTPPDQWQTIPPPPQPSNISVAGLLVILCGGILILLAVLYLLVSFMGRVVAPE